MKVDMLQEKDTVYYFNLGLSLEKEGQYEKAIEAFINASEINPEYPNIFYNLGNTYAKTSQHKLAISAYKKAIKLAPDQYLYFNNLAVVYAQTKKYELAIKNFKEVIKIKGDNLDTLNNLKKVYTEILSEEKSIKNKTELNNNLAETCSKIGFIYANDKKYKLAIDEYNKALELNPKLFDAYCNLAVSYTALNEYNLALENYNKAIKHNPNRADLYSNLGVLHANKQDYHTAIANYNKAIELNPNYAEAYYNLGISLMNINKVDEAICAYKKAVELSPDSKKTFNLGLSYLVNKDFKKGFKCYESRINMSSYKKLKVPKFSKPKWNGESLKDKTIYVYPEQGLGDSIQFSRYLYILKDMAKKVIFKPQESLVKLFKQTDLPTNIDIVDKISEDDFDFYCSIMSLPYLLNTDVNEIPCSSKYLHADPDKVSWYNEKYFKNDSFKIGIKWYGNPMGDKNRSAQLKNFYKLASLPNVKLYSLQKDEGIEQLKHLPNNFEIIDLGSTFNDFTDTAATIENLDLVITIDTSVAHLSAAMEKPTWILIPFKPEWRWFLDSETTPWYDSVKLFRQKTTDDWDSVIELIYKELELMFASTNKL